MIRLLVAAVTLIVLTASGAGAADMTRPVYKAAPSPLAAVYDWSGFYVGVHGGWGLARNRFHDTFADIDAVAFKAASRTRMIATFSTRRAC